MTAERKATTKGFESAGAVGIATVRSTLYTDYDIPLGLIDPDLDNPRKGKFDPATNPADQELVDSVDQHGIIEPLIVRSMFNNTNARYPIVCGHRRYAAAKYLELETVPCRIGNLTADAAREIQMVENLQRKDLSVVEEARALLEMLAEHGYTAETLGKKLGKHKSWVYGRVKLANLPELAAQSLDAGTIGEQVALLIARIPGEKSRAQAAKEICQAEIWENGTKAIQPMTFVRAKSHIEYNYSRELKGCEFDTKDPGLVKAAGACGACPKRTGNIPDSGARADVCTDPECFSTKTEAFRSAKLAEFRRQKFQVLTKEEGAKLMPYGGRLEWGSKYVDLNTTNDADPKKGTWNKLVGQNVVHVIAQDKQGKIHHLALKKDAEVELKKLGVPPDPWAAKRLQCNKEREESVAIRAQVDKYIFEQATKRYKSAGAQFQEGIPINLVRALIESASMSLSLESLLELRGCKTARDAYRPGTYAKYLKTLKPGDIGLFVAQLIAFDRDMADSEMVPKWLKFDQVKIEQQIKGESTNGKAKAGKSKKSAGSSKP
jgi:ParB/RepB/Spo0J family partition protein